ncbi:hypothetical protein BVX98_03145, partial [bacterium F11]
AAHNILAPRIRLDKEDDVYPMDIRLGVAYQPYNRLLLATDVNQTEDRSLKFHFGTEWKFNELIALRAGINETEVTAGIGFKLGNGMIDYAFGFNDAASGIDDLGGSHRFGFHMNFGGLLSDERSSVSLQRKGKRLLSQLSRTIDDPDFIHEEDVPELIEQTLDVVRKNGFVKPEDLYRARGYVYYLQKEYEKAVQALGEALDLSKGNKMTLTRHHKLALAEMSEERTKEIVANAMRIMKETFDKEEFEATVLSAKKILSFQPDHAEAQAYLDDAQRRIEEPILRELRIAKKKINQKKYLQAMNHLLKVKEMDPNNKEAAKFMGSAMTALKRQSSMLYKEKNATDKKVFEIGKDPVKSQQLYSQGLLY